MKEALRLADALDLYATGDAHQRDIEQAADELRRLHESNQELLAALKDATEGLEIASAGGDAMIDNYNIITQPKIVGYWVLYPQGAMRTMLGMYHKPTDEQIKNTEQLLGWQWRDA